jgi:hypothetical protein
MGTWTDWYDLGGDILSSPAVASRSQDTVTVVAVGNKNQAVLWEWNAASGWDSWSGEHDGAHHGEDEPAGGTGSAQPVAGEQPLLHSRSRSPGGAPARSWRRISISP